MTGKKEEGREKMQNKMNNQVLNLVDNFLLISHSSTFSFFFINESLNSFLIQTKQLLSIYFACSWFFPIHTAHFLFSFICDIFQPFQR